MILHHSILYYIAGGVSSSCAQTLPQSSANARDVEQFAAKRLIANSLSRSSLLPLARMIAAANASKCGFLTGRVTRRAFAGAQAGGHSVWPDPSRNRRPEPPNKCKMQE